MAAEVGGLAHPVPAIRTNALRRRNRLRTTLRRLLYISNRLHAIDPGAGNRDSPPDFALRAEAHTETGHAGAHADTALTEVYFEQLTQGKAFAKS